MIRSFLLCLSFLLACVFAGVAIGLNGSGTTVVEFFRSQAAPADGPTWADLGPDSSECFDAKGQLCPCG